LIDDAYDKTKILLQEKKQDVEKLAEALLEREVLFQSDVETLIGKRPFEEKKTLAEDEDNLEPHADGGISEGVPPYDPNVLNQQPAAKTGS
ncbi:MAG: peptidase M41, partial [Bacteroidota bacterium]|nr:peptidase M41 [Bacteroidota bacterium]